MSLVVRALAVADSPEAVAASLARAAAEAPVESPSPLASQMESVVRCFAGKGSVEEIEAALLNEASLEGKASEWAATSLKLIRKASPSSLKVTHRLLGINSKATLREALITEFTVCQRCLRPGSDFYEGIRSVLIDRGNPPARWQPAALKDVDEAVVSSFFSPLDADLMLALP